AHPAKNHENETGARPSDWLTIAILMRALVGLAVALGLAAPATASAQTHRRPAKHGHKDPKKRAARIITVRGHERIQPRERAQGQSVGAPWEGRLQRASQLPAGEGYYIRRPQRSFGTEAAVGYIERAISDTLEAFPDQHVLAIGDISAEAGGKITEHHSHQSG